MIDTLRRVAPATVSRSHCLEVVMVAIFGDESTDESKERVFAVAAIFGDDSQWSAAEYAWKSNLGGREFHAAEWDSEYANHTDASLHAGNLSIYKDLVQILVKSGLCGYSLGMDIASWRDVFGDDLIRDVEYLKCFTDVVRRTIELSKKFYGQDDPIQFTFDHRQESEYNAGLIYSYMVNCPEWKDRNVFLDTKISFDSRKNPQIQMADLLARETMKHLDNQVGPTKRPMRKSMFALASAGGRFQFDFYLREYFQGWHAKLGELEQRAGITRDRLAQWLERNKLQDSISNRIWYAIWLETKERKSRIGCRAKSLRNSLWARRGPRGPAKGEILD